MSKNFLIYCNDFFLRQYLIQHKKTTNYNIVFCNEKQINEFYNNTDNYKIALIHDQNYDKNFNHRNNYFDLINASDHFFIYCPEVTHNYVNFVKEVVNSNNNITCFVNGNINSLDKNQKCKSCLIWVDKTTWLYKKINEDYFHDLKPFENKSLYFDFLPGTPKGWRLEISNQIKNNSLENKIFSTPFFNSNEWQDIKVDYKDSNLWESGIEQIGENYNSGKFLNEIIPISVIVPKKIYNKTAYSIVSETVADHENVFISEKTVKPLLSKRLFISFSSKNILHTLRKNGFKTFDTVIDESYDDVADTRLRHKMAFDQVIYLCNQNQELIFEKIRPIVEHNFDHAMNYNAMEIIATEVFEKLENICHINNF